MSERCRLIADIEIKFGFDPLKSDTLKSIINDPVASSLWAMWKRSRIVSDQFAFDVLAVSSMVKKRDPQNIDSLRACFPTQCHDFTSGDVRAFVPEWLEVLMGRVNLYFLIDGKRYHCEIERLPESEG